MLAASANSCLSFAVECGTLAKGMGVFIGGLIMFVGSVYILLSAIFGRWMGFTVMMVALSGWMVIQSSLWLFGFWSQGLDTPTNLGPRGTEAAWVVLASGIDPESDQFQTEFGRFPEDAWATPPDPNNDDLAASIGTAEGAAKTYLAEQANEELGITDEFSPEAVTSTDFEVDDLRFAVADDDKTSLAVVQAHYVGGGPQLTVEMKHDSGSVPMYSLIFLFGSIIVFLAFLPLLDRAEKKRKEFLTGGTAPAWYGPA
jgi:hypothetical protein